MLIIRRSILKLAQSSWTGTTSPKHLKLCWIIQQRNIWCERDDVSPAAVLSVPRCVSWYNSCLKKKHFHLSTSRSMFTRVKDTLNPEDEKKKESSSDDSPKRKFPAERVITLPNILTASRIACAPAMGYFIWTGMYQNALACFAFAAATDLLDGFIARTFNQESDFGVVLDPLADKILLTTSFIAMYNAGLLPLWLVQGFVTRDIILVVAGLALRYFAFKDKPTLKKFFDLKNYPSIGFQPTMTSKCNTALQCLIIILHLSTNHLVGNIYYDIAIKTLHGTAALTTCISMTQYFLRAGENPRAYKAQSKVRVKI